MIFILASKKKSATISKNQNPEISSDSNSEATSNFGKFVILNITYSTIRYSTINLFINFMLHLSRYDYSNIRFIKCSHQ